ncbi:FAD-dependent oxidoreductase [Bradyrhizobium jicamae]|uniref:FAD-dependent oxidoreductase n=1 Tax=Bradyrhizobium jicamae TaxID=280332 RepID=A0ABS5FC67_9BRAD|nr:FAD-dependent oxidoreductase [Bradyrhizobium jicamae]MBR0794380.1 FAD-dependent oxidoreductase [Bradyrhizobium jicamae]MBR0933530.1 FAD-dependent oxidoreductase [Bradyrhizobium jicamae]
MIAAASTPRLAAGRYRIAIVGGGPSGFYAAEALLRSGQSVDVDMYERLPVPYGLVRFGVAPDHPKLKQVTRVFDRIAELPGFRFFGAVEIDRDVSVAALRSCYHAVILATGAAVGRPVDVPGERLPGSHQAGDFVAWYNGHPDFRHLRFDLAAEHAVIIGHGNVALDVARILAKTPEELRHTDIAAHALEALAASRVREIYLVGRGGPGRTRFAAKELQEFAELADCDPVVEFGDRPELAASPGADSEAEAALKVLREFSTRPVAKQRRCVFLFGLTPFGIEGDGRVRRMLFSPSQEQVRSAGRGYVALDCGLVFSSIGRRAAPISGIPYDEARGVHANIGGRLTSGGSVLPGLYVCGWGKRGPQGTIGTNRACSVETVANVLADLPHFDAPPSHPDHLFAATSIRRYVDYPAWGRIDAEEVARGGAIGKPREKLVAVEEMFAAAGGGVAC